jgi:hypothetical protein
MPVEEGCMTGGRMTPSAPGLRHLCEVFVELAQPLDLGDARYEWLNRLIAIGSAAREPAAVRVSVFEVL